MKIGTLKKPNYQRFGRRFGKYYGHLIDRDFLLGRDPREDNWIAPDNKPYANYKKKGDSYQLELPLPGFEKENISVYLKGDILTIKGKLVEDPDVNYSEYIMKEQFLDRFERSFELSPHTDKEKIKAEFKNGMLKINLYYNKIPRRGIWRNIEVT